MIYAITDDYYNDLNGVWKWRQGRLQYVTAIFFSTTVINDMKLHTERS